MKPTVLLAQVPVQTEATLLVLGQQLGLRIKSVPSICFRATLTQLLCDAESTYPADETVEESMLVMAGLDEKLTDRFLQELRQRQIKIALKAMLTQTNASWTLAELYHELCRERAAIASGK